MSMQCYTYGDDDKTVRVQVIGDKHWFCAKDVCDILDLKNSRDAISSLKNEQRANVGIPDTRQTRHLTFISESGLNKLIFKSRTPAAEAFQDWVCEEVLPSIRKTGRYELPADNTLEWEREKYRNALAERIMSGPVMSSDFHLRELAKEHLAAVIRGGIGAQTHHEKRYKDLTTLMQEMGYTDGFIYAERTRLGRRICKKYRDLGKTPASIVKLVNGGDREVKAYPPEDYEMIKGWVLELLPKNRID
jgi:prophage antirepressor-like protein